MTAEAQRIAIAEACGWKIGREGHKFIAKNPAGIVTAWGKTIEFCSLSSVPNYLSDLNAMHEAEKVLKDDVLLQDFQIARFVRFLEVLVSKNAPNQGWSFALLHATAAQRAEAFLQTLNLWK